MRYTLLLGLFIFLALPLMDKWPTTVHPPGNNPTIQHFDRYLQAFRNRYQAFWPSPSAGAQAATPNYAPIGEHTVKTWTDARGVVHFSDPRVSPGHAQDKRITVTDNRNLWYTGMALPCLQPSCSDPGVVLPRLSNGAFASLTLLAASILLALMHGLLRALWCRLHAHAQPGANSPSDAAQDAIANEHPAADDDPYRTLGIAANASHAEARQAYRRLMSVYHPDKVAHLGPALQETARQHSLAINAAWERICREHRSGCQQRTTVKRTDADGYYADRPHKADHGS